MSNCTLPWSGQDEFMLYDDCHVWVPLYRIFYAIICIIALVDFFLGYLRVSQGKGLFAICLTAYSFWLAIACGIRLTTGWVIGQRNVALNMTCALTLVFFWCGLSLYVVKYLDLIFETEKLKGTTAGILGRAHQILYLFMALTLVLQILNLVVPTLSEVDFLPTLWITIYIQATFLSVLFFCFGVKARSLLKSIAHCGDIYRTLLSRLDFVLVPWTVGYVSCTIVIFLLLFADTFERNQYILMPFTWLIEALIAFSVLVATRGSAVFGSIELDSQNKDPQLVSSTPAGDGEISRLSESRSQLPSETSGNSTATATPNLPDRTMVVRFSPLIGGIGSMTPNLLQRQLKTPDSPDTTMVGPHEDPKFRYNRFYKGMSRLEEGEWVNHEEVVSLTIDTTDRNPKIITMIETEDDEV